MDMQRRLDSMGPHKSRSAGNDRRPTRRGARDVHLSRDEKGVGTGRLARDRSISYGMDTAPCVPGSRTTIDLFCGAGGITEGFRRAGFSCLYANDIDHWAIETFKANHPGTRADNRPVENVDAAALRRELRLEPGDLDVVVGGPPCQGFSINAPERFLDDPRNSLFKHYVRFLDEFKPKTLLLENVPGMLSLGGGVIFDQIIHELGTRGYEVRARILFAAHYGVPQERWRMIVIGARISPPPSHPYPSHYAHARSMRAGGSVTFNHAAGKLSPQNAERMKYVKPGGSWRDIPRHLLPRGMQQARLSDHTKRYGRLRNDGLAGTVLTKCDPHWGAVFLPNQDRALTVREAARLQSFPDSYKFLGPRVAQYEQVGNAVPVLMAEAVAREFRHALGAVSAGLEMRHVA